MLADLRLIDPKVRVILSSGYYGDSAVHIAGKPNFPEDPAHYGDYDPAHHIIIVPTRRPISSPASESFQSTRSHHSDSRYRSHKNC